MPICLDQSIKWKHGRQGHDMIVAPRGLNACTLFNAVDYLISDTSSLLAEFTPFGVSIESEQSKPGQDPNNSGHELYFLKLYIILTI